MKALQTSKHQYLLTRNHGVNIPEHVKLLQHCYANLWPHITSHHIAPPL